MRISLQELRLAVRKALEEAPTTIEEPVTPEQKLAMIELIKRTSGKMQVPPEVVQAAVGRATEHDDWSDVTDLLRDVDVVKENKFQHSEGKDLTDDEINELGAAIFNDGDGLLESDKPVDPRKKIGKVVKYLDRPFRVRDVLTRPSPYGQGHIEILYTGTFDDEPDSAVYHAPIDKVSKGAPMRAKKPEDFDVREFLEQDIEAFLRAPGPDGHPNIQTVRARWPEISKDLSWMEKYIFENKWLTGPMAKTNDQISVELETKIAIVKASETRAFHKIERIITGDGSMTHDLQVIKIARAMLKAAQPMAKIIVYLRSELHNKDLMNQLDFLR